MTPRGLKRPLLIVALALLAAAWMIHTLQAPSRADRGAQGSTPTVAETFTPGATATVTPTTASPTATPTFAPPTETATPTATTPTVESPTPSPTATDVLTAATNTPTATPTLPPTSTPTPTATPTDAPTATQTPTAEPPTPPPATEVPPTASPVDRVLTFVSEQRLLVVGGLLAALLVLGLLLILSSWRRGGEQPAPAPPPSAPPAPSVPHLETADGPGAGRRFELKPRGVTIGRETGNDLVVTEDIAGWETVSRRHARIYQQADEWMIEDLDSMNGIYVNGGRTGRNILRDGWQLQIGGVTFIFHAGSEASR